MKPRRSLLVLASILAGQLYLVRAAEPVHDWILCPSNQAGIQYPHHSSDGRVKFCSVAPQRFKNCV